MEDTSILKMYGGLEAAGNFPDIIDKRVFLSEHSFCIRKPQHLP